MIQIQDNRIKNPNWQEVTSWLNNLQAQLRIWTRYDREQIHQVAGAGLRPGTTGLRVQRPDHWAMQPPKLFLIKSAYHFIVAVGVIRHPVSKEDAECPGGQNFFLNF